MGAAVAVPLALSALSAGANYYNTRQVAKDQEAIQSQGLADQRARQQQADAEVANAVGAIERSTPEAAQKEATDQFLSQLRRNRSQAVGEEGLGGRQFAQDLAGANADVTRHGDEGADILARLNAPGRQREAEGVTLGRTASNIGTIGRNAGADAFLTDLRMRNVQRNPWVDAAGTFTGGLGSGLAASGYTPRTRVPRGTRVDAPVLNPGTEMVA